MDGLIGVIYKCLDSGWIYEEFFFEWLQYFIQYVKFFVEELILLVLDNYVSYILLVIYEYCKKNYIYMLFLLFYILYCMQLLDVFFFGLFKVVYKRECDLFMKS